MKFLAALATAMFAASTAARASEPLVVKNPGPVTVCKSFVLSWSGGTPPYRFELDEDLDSRNTKNLTQLVQFEPRNGTSFTWVFNLSPSFIGDSFVLKVIDRVGESSLSAPFIIRDSSDHSCFSFSEPTNSKMLSKGQIVGICLGILSFLVLSLFAWRAYVLHRRRRLSEFFRQRKNIGTDQKFPLSPIQQ